MYGIFVVDWANSRRKIRLNDLKKAVGYVSAHRVTIVSVLILAIALTCIVSFGGNRGEQEEYSEPVIGSGVDESLDNDISYAEGYAAGYGIYIDGTFVAAVAEEHIVDDAIAAALNAKINTLGISEEMNTSFVNEFKAEPAVYEEHLFTDYDGLLTMLGFIGSNRIGNTVTDYEGKLIDVKLSVISTCTVVEENVREHSTKVIYTDSLSDGKTKTLVKGVDGEVIDTYEIISIDGVVSERVLVSTETIVETVDEVLSIGTKVSSINTSSIGVFIKPYDGIISSYFGIRWGRQHKGIDIVGDHVSCKNDPAYAVADGTVILAEYSGGYGNCVIIDHGNGIQTLYAHFGSLCVKEGDVVKAGDTVGLIGTTGNSTGYHLHFEVYVDGQYVNPLYFVNYD